MKIKVIGGELFKPRSIQNVRDEATARGKAFWSANFTESVNDAYYSCGTCGIELNGDEVDEVAAGRFPATGEMACCPVCGEENSVNRWSCE